MLLNPPYRTGRSWRALLLVLALAAAVAASGATAVAAKRGPDRAKAVNMAAERAVSQARALSADWGRCPTARRANALLKKTLRTRRPAARLTMARRTIRAYDLVADECILPVDQPTVIIPDTSGPVAPRP